MPEDRDFLQREMIEERVGGAVGDRPSGVRRRPRMRTHSFPSACPACLRGLDAADILDLGTRHG